MRDLRRHRLETLVLLTAIAALGLGVVFKQQVHQDVGWYLHVAEQLLAGAELSTDIFEVNLPLILWLYVPPELLSRILGLHSPSAASFYLIVLAGTSIILTARGLWGDYDVWLIVVAIVLIPAASLIFGVKDHLLVVFFLPYLTYSARSRVGDAQPTHLAILTGVFAGMGVSLKPYFVLFPLLIEGVSFLDRSSNGYRLGPHFLSLLGTGAASLLATAALSPHYFAFGWEWWPAYSSYNIASWERLLLHPVSVLGILTLGLGAILRRYLLKLYEKYLLDGMMAALLSALIVMWIQRRGGLDHLYVPLAFTLLILGFVFQATTSDNRLARSIHGVLGVASAGTSALVLGISALLIWVPSSREQRSARLELIATEYDARSVASMSTRLSAVFPASVYANLDYIGPYPSLWQFAAFYGVNEVKPMPADVQRRLERKVRKRYVHEVLRKYPDILIVDTKAAYRWLPESFHWMTYFKSFSEAARCIDRAYEKVRFSSTQIAYVRPAEVELSRFNCPGLSSRGR